MGKGAIIKFKKSANDQNGVKKVNKDKARRVGSCKLGSDITVYP